MIWPTRKTIDWDASDIIAAANSGCKGLTVDWLKNESTMIHYFGLGFIQIKLKNPSLRIHIYTELLPPITSEEDIHNHRYDFTSYIVKGEFKQELFSSTHSESLESKYIIEAESCKEGQESNIVGYCNELKPIHKATYVAGSNYHLDHDTFHRVSSTNAITLLHRGDYKKAAALVARPIGEAKVCPFSQKIEEDKLWNFVKTCIT